MGRVYTNYSFDSTSGYLTIETDVSDYIDDSYVEAYWEDSRYFNESFYDSTSFSFEFDVWDGGVFAHDVYVENDFTGESETYSEDYHVYVYASAGRSIDGSGVRDIAFGSDFNDVISLGAANDDAFGGAGDDYIDGGSGADVMQGETGNDIYIVSSTGDRTIEYAGQGTDIVRAFTHWTLAANIERLELQGSANLVGTGNGLNNSLIGNSGTNVLRGAAGNDYIDGGAGADNMHGGTGNDTFIVAATGDQTIELAGQGTDTVQSYINWTLSDNVERLGLLGTASLNGTGNALNNTLVGNSGNNTLNGAAGDDYMVGGAGNDTYLVASVGDRTVEASGGGTDTVRSYLNWTLAANVERLELLGTANLNGTGNALANTLVGNSGNNILNGGAGNDYMAGGAGNDTFFFNTALGASNIDTITDYNVVQDTVRLENGIFTALVGTGTLTAAQFVKNASGTATDANDRIIYETDTGKLFYDSNGSAAGGQVQFAKLAAGLALTASDFFIV